MAPPAAARGVSVSNLLSSRRGATACRVAGTRQIRTRQMSQLPNTVRYTNRRLESIPQRLSAAEADASADEVKAVFLLDHGWDFAATDDRIYFSKG